MKVLPVIILALTLLVAITFGAPGYAYNALLQSPPAVSHVTYTQPALSYGYQTVFSYPQSIYTQPQFLPQPPFVQTPIYTQFPGVIGTGLPVVPAQAPQQPVFPQVPVSPPQSPEVHPQEQPESASDGPSNGSEADDLSEGQSTADSAQGNDEDTVSIEAAQ